MQVVKGKYACFEDFFHHVLPTGELGQMLAGPSYDKDKVLYRGEPSGKFKLLPSALREGSGEILNAEWGGSDLTNAGSQIRCEHYKLWQFYKIANEHGLKVSGSDAMREEYLGRMAQTFGFQKTGYTWLSREYEDLAALAQHYGVPTRMLDWTSDLFTAMYFASSKALKRWDKGEYDTLDNLIIWILNGGLIHSMTKDRNSKGIPIMKDGVWQETIINPLPLKVVVPPYYDNPNLNAQKGVLSYWEVEMPSRAEEDSRGHEFYPIDRRPLDELLQGYDLGYDSSHIDILYRVELDISECAYMYSVMNDLGYNAAKLFPGYAGVKQKMEEDDIHWRFCKWLETERCKHCQKYSSGKTEQV